MLDKINEITLQHQGQERKVQVCQMEQVLAIFKLLKPPETQVKAQLEEDFQKQMRLSERNANVLVVKKLQRLFE